MQINQLKVTLKAGAAPKRFIREFRNVNDEYEVGQEVTADTLKLETLLMLQELQKVKVSKVQLNVMVKVVDQWLTVLISTEHQVQ